MPPPDAIAEPIVNSWQGIKAAWRQPGSYGRNDSGYFQTFIFEGHKDQITALAATFDTNGVTWEVQHLTGRRARLTANLSATPAGGTVLEDVWELENAETQKELLEADFPFGSLPALSRKDRGLVKSAIEANLKGPGAEALAFTGGDNEADNVAGCFSFYYLMRSGVTSFPVEASIIRHTYVVTNAHTAQASFLNVGRLLSNASMQTLEGSGSLFLFSLPTLPTATQFIETDGDLKYAWKKSRPRIVRQARTRWQIVTTYQFGLWATRMHGAVL